MASVNRLAILLRTLKRGRRYGWIGDRFNYASPDQRNVSAKRVAARMASVIMVICGFTPSGEGMTDPSITQRPGTS